MSFPASTVELDGEAASVAVKLPSVVPTHPVVPVPVPVPSELLVTQEETHEELKEVMKVSTPVQPLLQPTINNTGAFLDGTCHLKDPEVEIFLASLRAFHEKLLDEYLQAQLLACNGKELETTDHTLSSTSSAFPSTGTFTQPYRSPSSK
mgnify:CR=1 FL=1